MAFLGVDNSISGRRWIGPDDAVSRHAEALGQQTGKHAALCTVLARLGVAAEDVESYLAPELRTLLPDPRGLRDMERAAARINAAVKSRQRIAIFADYDVDGATSAAQLIWWLRSFGITATLYVPDRIDEGYGPNVPAMTELAAAHDLIICVDCGTLSHEPIAAVTGADVIVLDHHLGGETLPPAHAVVNPNRQDESGDLAHLCAAAVVFLTLVEAGRQLREAGVQGPNLMEYLDLVALGTVADVAPLVGVNRAFVRQGLRVMGRRARPGLVALSDTAKIDSAPTAYHLGYILGPRINAGGRVGQADLGAQLLASDDLRFCQGAAERLETLNTDRRTIEAHVRDEAMAQAETRGFEAPLVWAAGDGWHAGVVGIVASRLKEACNRPSIVIGFEGDEGKGSGRSVDGIDLGAMIQKLAHEGLIEKGGGHKMAAGLSLSRAQLEPAMTRLSALMAKQGADTLGPADLRVDSVLHIGAATPELIAALEAAGPYGAGVSGPRFVIPLVSISFAKPVGTGHVKFTCADEMGQRLEGIAFGAMDGPLGPVLTQNQGDKLHLAGRLELNRWNGRETVQLRLEDAVRAG